jgi:class 3 adenylate cyclase
LDDSPTRRLAAILAADVVGYSRLMGVDEEGTLRRIKSLRSEIIEPHLAKKSGRLVKTTGDGFLIEFASVVSAFRFAVDIQGLLAQSEPVHESEAMRLRIGINVGEIIADDDGDVYGDGVNVAARLEQICPVGGVCVSERAWRDLRQLGVEFVDLGPQNLKNIRDSIRAFTFLPDNVISETPRRFSYFTEFKRKFLTFLLAVIVTSGALSAYLGLQDGSETSLLLIKPVEPSQHQLAPIADSASDALKVAFSSVPGVILVDDFGLLSRDKIYVIETRLHQVGEKLRFTFTFRNASTGAEILRHSINRPLSERQLAADQVGILSRRVFACTLTGTTLSDDSIEDRALQLYAQMCSDSLNDTLGNTRLLEFARQITKISPNLAVGWSARAYYSAQLRFRTH